jgi:hypothetical protein
MHEEFPDGVFIRYPGRKQFTIHRTALSAMGPYHQVAADGHEKLGALALRMGGVGLPIYAWTDIFSSEVPFARVIPDCRSPSALAHLKLDMIQDLGCLSSSHVLC